MPGYANLSLDGTDGGAKEVIAFCSALQREAGVDARGGSLLRNELRGR
jgi:hypothetical protein